MLASGMLGHRIDCGSVAGRWGLVCGYAGTSSALLRNSCEFWRVVFPYTFVLFFQNIGNMYPRTRKIIVA